VYTNLYVYGFFIILNKIILIYLLPQILLQDQKKIVK